MTDNYKGFKFGDLRIAPDASGQNEFKGFIINSGEDLTFSNAPNFENSYSRAFLSDYEVFMGTTKSSRIFSFRVIIEEILLADYKKLLTFLSPDITGKLKFDYNQDFEYDVKLSSISVGTYTVIPGTPSDKYHVEFDLEFITTSDWAGKKEIIMTEAPYNQGVDSTLDSYYKIEIDNNTQSDQTIIVEIDSNVILDVTIPNGSEYLYYSQWGIILDDSGNFIKANEIKSFKSKQAVQFTVTGNGAAVTITQIQRETI